MADMNAPFDSRLDPSEIMAKLKEDVRPYFAKIDCSLRVLGSQFGLEPSELTDLERLSTQTSIELRQLLLEKCFDKEKITSLEQFASVLEKPALNQTGIAKEIRNRLSQFSRQISMESAASSITSAASCTSPFLSLTSSMEASVSLTIENKTGRIELCDAVNEIMKVPHQNLHSLGSNLELDEDRLQDVLTHYSLEERHQRLMELWFKKESDTTWERLSEALQSSVFLSAKSNQEDSNQRQLSTSMDGISVTLSSPSNSLMFKSNLIEIKGRFANLLSHILSVLVDSHVTVADVHRVLIDISECRSELPRTSLDNLFRTASDKKLWHYDHYYPLETIVRRFIRDHLSFVSEYKQELSGFLTTARLIDFIGHTNLNDSKRGESKLPLESYETEYDTLATKLNTGRNIYMLSLMYVQEMWNSFAEEFRIPSLTAVVEKVLEGCLEITWRITPSAAKLITDAAHIATPFFRKHNIIYVSVSGTIVYDVRQVGSSIIEANGYQMDVGSDMLTAVGQFEVRFSELLDRAKGELSHMDKPVEIVYRLLTNLTGKTFHKYVLDLRDGPPSNLDELFDDLNSYRSNSLEYDLLHEVIRRNGCSAALRKKMEQFARDVKEFKRHTTLSKLTVHKGRILKRKPRLKAYHKKLRTKHDIDPDTSTFMTVDHFQQEIKALSKCHLYLVNMEVGSVTLEWTVLEEDEYTIVDLFCSEEGKELLQRHHISDVSIDDIPIDDSLLLLTAATYGKWDRVSALLQDKLEGIDINYTHSMNGQTVLHKAASVKEEGSVEVVKMLLKGGADPNIQDIDGRTPLMKAIVSGHLQVLELMLRAHSPTGCQLSIKDKENGWSALHIAASEGRLDAVKLLVDHASDEDLMLTDKNGQTALQAVVDFMKKQHLHLLAEAQSELLQTHNRVAAITSDVQCPEPVIAKHHGYVVSSIKRGKFFPWSDLRRTVFFRHFRLYARNWFEHELLSFLVEMLCGLELKSKMAKYANCVEKIRQLVTLKEAVEFQPELAMGKSDDIPPNFTDITMEVSVEAPTGITLTMLESFRKHVHGMLRISLAECALQMSSINLQPDDNRAIVRWMLPEELTERLFYADYQELTQVHHIDKLTIDGKSTHSLSFLKEMKCKNIGQAISILEKFDQEVDINCSDHETGATALAMAAAQGNLEMVDILLHKGADMNIVDKNGHTALMSAAQKGHRKMIQVLLDLENKHLCDTNIQEKVLGWTALHFAADEGREDIVELLIDPVLQTSMILEDKDGRTALQIAQDKYHTKIVELLSPAEIDTKQEKMPKLKLPLHWPTLRKNKLIQAVKRRSLAEVKKLLEDGEHPDVCDKRKWTSLLHASHNGQEEIVKALLEKGADPNWRSTDGGYTALILASYRGFVEVLQLLLEYRADVNIQNKQGSTALQLVCLYSPLREKSDKNPTKRRCEVVRLLLDHKADINLADKLDRTPLIAASGSGFPGVVRILLDRMKDDVNRDVHLNSVMDRNWTALMKAAQIGDVNIAKMLIGAGASLTAKAKDGVTALHVAVYRNRPGVVKLLAKKDHPEILNARDQYGNTPLILATKAKNEEIINILLDAKVDVNLATKDGENMTALMYAVKHGYTSIIRTFVLNKADLLIQDAKKRTARDIAKSPALRQYLYEQEQLQQNLIVST